VLEAVGLPPYRAGGHVGVVDAEKVLPRPRKPPRPPSRPPAKTPALPAAPPGKRAPPTSSVPANAVSTQLSRKRNPLQRFLTSIKKLVLRRAAVTAS